MTTHTPGPWTIVRSPRPDAGSPDYLRIDGAAGRRVAEIYGEEDVRLIAAAPELLVALRYARAFAAPWMASMSSAVELVAAIDTAIAKAEGRS